LTGPFETREIDEDLDDLRVMRERKTEPWISLEEFLAQHGRNPRSRNEWKTDPSSARPKVDTSKKRLGAALGRKSNLKPRAI
jgi:hypothetical protein